jgi:LuxR family transcriptional regulator, maltose regulon positive regulatory protein
MSLLVTKTKVILPQRRADILSRPRLIDRLNRISDSQLVVVIAPPGYGKSALLIDFAHQSDLVVCWYSLDPLDCDPQRFLTHFIAAISHRYPAFGAMSNGIIPAFRSLTLDQLVTVIVNDIYENIGEHFLLILDDFHLVNQKGEINEFINRFIQNVSENCHLILSSRSLLSLPDMHLLVARSQVKGLGYEQLAFTPAEIQALVLQNFHMTMPEYVAQELTNHTEGWITGMLLATQTLWSKMTDAARQAQYSRVGLYDYLAQEILERQPAKLQEFLLRSGFLDEFNRELCQAIWGEDEDWPALIEATSQNNLFVLAVDDDGRWLRYHNLFQEFLQARFKEKCPDEVEPLLRKIISVYADREEWEKAWMHCQQLEDLELSVSLIDAAGPSLLKAGRLELLLEWCNTPPAHVIANHPNLLSLKGIALVVQGQVELGLPDLNSAQTIQEANQDLADLALTLARRTYAHRIQGRYQASLEDAQKALELAEQLGLVHLKAEALKAIGANLYQMGKLEEAVNSLQAALEEYRWQKDQPNIANVLLDLGLTYVNSGKYELALTNYHQALAYWKEINNPYGLASVYNNIGSLNHLLGDYEQAVYSYEEGYSNAQRTGSTRVQAYILCGIGDAYKDLGAVEESHSAYEQARPLAQKVNDHFLLLFISLAEAELARLEGNLYLAQRLFQGADQIVQESASYYEQGLGCLTAGKLALSEFSLEESVASLSEAANRFSLSGQVVDEARSRFYLAWAHGLRGNTPSAIDQLLQAFDVAQRVDSAHVLVTCGWEAQKWLQTLQDAPEIKRLVKQLLKAISSFDEQLPALRRKLRKRALSIPISPPRLNIRAFGRAEVEKDNQPVQAAEWVHQRRVRELFFYLLAEPHGATRERICDVFWPDSSLDELRLIFKNVIYRLRYALGKEVLVFENDHYRFNTGLDYEYDVETFLDYIQRAGQAAGAAEKVEALAAAVDLYRGPYFLEAEGTWAFTLRTHLEQAFMKAVSDLVKLHLENRNFKAALENCERALTLDPSNEEIHALAMRAFAGAGDRAGVIRQYEQCCQALTTDLGIEPASHIRNLYHTLIG